MGYVAWILISAAIYSKSTEDEYSKWLEFPSMLSCIIACIIGLLELIERYAS